VVALAVAVAAAPSDSLDSWQALLAAELTPVKALEFGRRIESRSLDRNGILVHPSLSEAEAQRASRSKVLSGSVPEGVQLIPYGDFPPLLSQISVPPPALFAWGDFSSLCAPTAAIVGTRGASA